MAASNGTTGGGSDRSGAVVAVLAGFLVTVAALAGAAILFPDLVDDIDIGSSDSSTSSTTEPPEAGSPEEAEALVTAFAAAVGTGDFSAVEFTDGPGASPAGATTTTTAPEETTQPPSSGSEASADVVSAAPEEFAELTEALDPFTVTATAGAVNVTGATATAPITATWTLDNGTEWISNGEVELVVQDGRWLVAWSPAALESSLRPGDRLVQRRLAADRGQILGQGGAILVDNQEVVTVGIQPSRVDDLPSLTARVAELIPGVDAAELQGRVEAADPGAFVEVATLPRADYDLIRDDIFPLPGTVFRESVQPVATEPDFARALLGRSGEVTAEIIEQFPGLYVPGDFVGLSGLQGTYNAELTGLPGVEVVVIRARPIATSTTQGSGLITTSSVVEDGQIESLFVSAPVDGQAVQTSLDVDLQRAAETALDNQAETTTALVAIRVSTGEVVALATGPRGSTVNLAATGQYPPGSIFKVVSAYAVLRDRLGPNDEIDCPAEVVIGGAPFGNAGGSSFGQISFRRAMAVSCNTAFINATRGYDLDVLNLAAADLGIGVPYDLGIPAYAGDAPIATDEVDFAAASFGQGRVLLSPLAAAVMAATAADGVFRSPLLVVSPGPETPPVEVPLEPGAAADLRDLMRAVVTDGTGQVLAGLPGPPVGGKTGTAEFGGGNPPQTHAWFVGYQGDLAVAVFVEGGSGGGSVAAPLAGVFFNLANQ